MTRKTKITPFLGEDLFKVVVVEYPPQGRGLDYRIFTYANNVSWASAMGHMQHAAFDYDEAYVERIHDKLVVLRFNKKGI